MSALELLDWRRQVFALYDGVRAELYPHVAHAGWSVVGLMFRGDIKVDRGIVGQLLPGEAVELGPVVVAEENVVQI